MNCSRFFVLSLLFVLLFSFSAFADISCKDSDGGKNYFSRGSASEIECDGDCKTVNFKSDACSSGSLVEYFCQSDRIASEEFSCDCENGACLGQSDCVPNLVCGSWSSCIPVFSDDCSVTDKGLQFQSCNDGCGGKFDRQQDCVVRRDPEGQPCSLEKKSGTCKSGECVFSPAFCSDSDGGKLFYLKGAVSSSSGFFEDSCVNNVLKEYFCNPSGQPEIESFSCQCGEGLCIAEGLPAPCGYVGDADFDGMISKSDVELVLGIVNGVVKLSEKQLVRADVDGDTSITSIDALLIDRYVKGLEVSFKPCANISSEGNLSINKTSNTTSQNSSGLPSPCWGIGDLDFDSLVSYKDYELVREYVNGLREFNWSQIERADVSGDGSVTSVDSLFIFQYISRSKNSFPACSKLISKTPPCLYYGDVNFDGVVTPIDSDLIREYVNGVIEFEPQQKKRSDVDANRAVDEVDALLINRFLQDLVTSFPVCGDNSTSINWSVNSSMGNESVVNATISIATLKTLYRIGERVELTDPPNFPVPQVNSKSFLIDQIKHSVQGDEIKGFVDGRLQTDAPYNGYLIEFNDEPLIAYQNRLRSVRKEELKKLTNNYSMRLESRQESTKADISARLKKNLESNSDQNSIKILGEYSLLFNGIALDITDAQAQSVKNSPFVKSVTPNYIREVSLMDSTRIIDAQRVWQMLDSQENRLTGKGVTIAVIDTGVDYTHPDLGGCLGAECKVIGGYDFVTCNKFNRDYTCNDSQLPDSDPMDHNLHGTHVAATSAGDGALKGVAPGASIYAVRVLNDYGSGGTDWVLSGIENSLDPNGDGNYDDHVDIISMSLGGRGTSTDPLSKAVDNAVDFGVVVVVTAGNSGPFPDSVGSPGTAQKAITVAATDKSDIVPPFSSRGLIYEGRNISLKPDVAAPGVDICAAKLTTLEANDLDCIDSRHIMLSGTSMAAPHVAGLAALILQSHPDWNPVDVKNVILSTATNLNKDLDWQGYGRINASAAIYNNGNKVFLRVDRIENFIETDLDGKMEAGELVYAPLRLINGRMPARNVNLRIESNSPFISIIDSELHYGNFESYSSKLDSFSFIMENASMGRVIKFNVLISAENYSDVFTFSLYLPDTGENRVVSNLILSNYNSPLVEDLNGDGIKEIISADAERVFVWNSDWTISEGWPRKIGDLQNNVQIFNSPPAVGDIDGNGQSEIIVKVNDSIHVFNRDGSYLSGWPKSFGGSIESIPVLADFNLDGKREIVFFVKTDFGNKLYIVNGSGATIPGWPIDIIDNIFSSPSVADINMDGFEDIVVSGRVRSSGKGLLTVFESDGSILWSREMVAAPFLGSPSVADLDRNGNFEIVVVSEESGGSHYEGVVGNCSIYIFEYDGSVRAGWPKVLEDCFLGVLASPSLGDVDGDGKLDVVVSKLLLGTTYVFDSDGRVLSGWPQEYPNLIRGVPAIADIDNDGVQDIVVSLGGLPIMGIPGYLLILNSSGDLQAMYGPEWSGGSSSPLISDINNDGVSEILWQTNGNFYLIPQRGMANNSNFYWTQYRADNMNTGKLASGREIIPQLAKSKIDNFGNNVLEGNLILKVQREITGTWSDEYVVVSRRILIPSRSFLALDTIWNESGAFIPVNAGNYRVYVEVRGDDGIVLKTVSGELRDSYEFIVENLDSQINPEGPESSNRIFDKESLGKSDNLPLEKDEGFISTVRSFLARIFG